MHLVRVTLSGSLFIQTRCGMFWMNETVHNAVRMVYPDKPENMNQKRYNFRCREGIEPITGVRFGGLEVSGRGQAFYIGNVKMCRYYLREIE